MKNSFVGRNIIRLNDSSGRVIVEDSLLSEKKMVLDINKGPKKQIVMTAGNEELWTIGNLLTREIINDMEDILSIEISESSISVKTASKINDKEENKISATWTIPASLIQNGIKWISEAPLYKQTGSTHVAALISISGERLFIVEDIKRHNAVDKAIGWLFKNKFDPASVILFTSGRLPEDMVRKAKISKLPLVASISAATEQGALLAERSNITLVGFVREGRMNIYSHPERIV